MKRIAASIGAAIIVPFLAWTTGFDFDTRGLAAATAVVYTLIALFAVYFYPG